MEEKPTYLTRDALFHGICFYLVWFSTVYFAGTEMLMLYFCIPLAIWLGQCLWETHAKRLATLLPSMMVFIITGILTDLLSMQFGIMTFQSNPFISPIPPPWLMFLWFEFSLVFILLLQRYFSRWFLLAMLGGSGFMLAFYVGSLFNAVTLMHGLPSLLALGFIWACILPLQARLCLYWRLI